MYLIVHSPLWLLHISFDMKVGSSNFVLDQEKYLLISFNILISCLLDNIRIP